MAGSEEIFQTMIARVSPEDIVLYANAALAGYLHVPKSDLIGAPLEILAARTRGEISSCFQRLETGRASNRLVTDDDGRVFEVKSYSEGGVLDIVLDEVTTMDSVSRDLRHVSGTPVDDLDEDELRTARQPERRYLTISQVRLNGIARLSELLVPLEMRLMLNSFVEESAEAIIETGCTYCQTSPGSVTGIFGAPRYFSDHALRAVKAACNQIEKAARLRAGLFRQGREMPPLSCGIWTGEAFVGALGASATQRYSAVGTTVDFASELCKLARPGEILIAEPTLREFVKTLPGDWDAVRAERVEDPDLSDFHWQGEQVVPLSEEHARGVWLIGPGVRDDTSRVEYFADYLYAFQAHGLDEPVPVLRIVRPAAVGDSLELGADNVVTTQFSQSLGKYKLLGVIGTGGMGKVWKGQDRYGNIVAVKVLHSAGTNSDAQIKRFQREADVMSRLPHRNICRVFEMGEFEGIQFLVMEFVDGLTLSDLLYERTRDESVGSVAKPLADIKSLIHALREEHSSRGEGEPAEDETPAPRAKKTRVLPVEQTLNIFLKVCDAVQFAHEHGVLHRDLKPGNILLREDGEPLVADFGLAKISSGDSGQSLSVSGNVVGTLENMSPEQAESSKDVDERADVYALGTILFQMLTGRRHFEATGNIVADAQALQAHEPPRPRGFNPKLDGDLEVIVLKALRNSPRERYRSVAALGADIERYRRGEIISARPVTTLALAQKLVMRNRAITGVIAASLLLFITGSITAFWQITDRAKAAEAALAKAEEQELLAMKNQRVAEQKQKEAQDAYDKLKLSESALSHAESARTAAQSETAQEKKRRVEAEKEAAAKIVGAGEKLTEVGEKLTEAQNKIKDLENQTVSVRAVPDSDRTPMPGPLGFPDGIGELSHVNGMMNLAMIAFDRELGGGALAAYERNPEMILGRISSGLETVCRTILLDPTLPRGWMLKGRYHLACLEVAQARESFDMAVKSAAARRVAGLPDLLGRESPEALAAITTQLAKPVANRFEKAAELLKQTGSESDRTAAGVIEFLQGKPLARRSLLGSSPTGRVPGSTEIAVGLIAANGGVGQIALQNDGREVAITGIARPVGLSALKSLSPQPVAVGIGGAEVIEQPDWAVLGMLPLESLDLSECPIDSFPAWVRGFSRLQSLSLKSTRVADITPVRNMPVLTTLDISGSAVADLNPLAACRKLHSLDIGTLAVQSVRGLAFLPLVRLTFNPEMVSDRESLKVLRSLRTLRVLRKPGDPDDQTTAEFWRRFDAGDYGG